jgi:hypothetical protein
MNHIVAAILIAERQDDLIREAEERRRAHLVRGARRSPWSAFTSRLAALRGAPAARPRGARPAPASSSSTSTGTRAAAA